MHFPGKLAAPAPHGHDPEHQRRDADDDHDQFKCVKIISRQFQRIREHFQVLGVKRRHPLGQQIAVAGAQEYPEHAQQDPGKHTPAEQINDHKCHEYHKRIVQEHKRRPCHIIPCLEERQPGNRLDQKIDHARQQELKRQGEPVHPFIDRLHLLCEPAVSPLLQDPLPAFLLFSVMPLNIFRFQIFQIFNFCKKAFNIRPSDMNLLHL